MKKYKVTRCLNPEPAHLENHIKADIVGGWELVSHSNYIDPTTRLTNVNLVYVLKSK